MKRAYDYNDVPMWQERGQKWRESTWERVLNKVFVIGAACALGTGLIAVFKAVVDFFLPS